MEKKKDSLEKWLERNAYVPSEKTKAILKKELELANGSVLRFMTKNF